MDVLGGIANLKHACRASPMGLPGVIRGCVSPMGLLANGTAAKVADAEIGATSSAREMQPTPATMDAGARDEEGREGMPMHAFHGSDLCPRGGSRGHQDVVACWRGGGELPLEPP